MLRLLTLFFVLLIHARIHADSDVIIIDKGDHFLECREAPLELAIVLDSSSSINLVRGSFRQSKQFLKDFLSQYVIGPDKVRTSLVSYGLGIYTENQQSFNLNEHTTSASLMSGIDALVYQGGTRTDTGAAINYMRENQLSTRDTRPGAKRVAIVITDGNSQEEDETKKAAQAARASGIKMIAVGVGEVKQEELVNIAGSTSRTFKVGSYKDLKKIKNKLGGMVCRVIKKPKTECGDKNPADIYFVFSPLDLGRQTTKWMAVFINEFIKNDDILQTGFRVGVVSDGCTGGFDLDRHLLPDNAGQIQTHLKSLMKSPFATLARRVMTPGFFAKSGGRPNARDVAVLVSTDEQVLKKYAIRLKVAGKMVIIIDPYNTGVVAQGAITISGQNPAEAAAELADLLCQ